MEVTKSASLLRWFSHWRGLELEVGTGVHRGTEGEWFMRRRLIGDLDPDLLNIPAGVLILLVSSSKLV